MFARRATSALSRLPQRPSKPQLQYRLRAFRLSQIGNAEEPTVKAQSRLDRTINRLPKFLQRYLIPFRNAPLSHVTSFLILHEITAIVPLFGFWAIFHYTNWLPSYFSEGKWVHEGIEKFSRYFRKKGWLETERDHPDPADGGNWEIARDRLSKQEEAWTNGQGRMRTVIEAGTAWAITKALLPLRIFLSVWGAPRFARAVLKPITDVVWRLFGKGRS